MINGERIRQMSDAERAIELLEEYQPYLKGDPNELSYALALSALKKNQKAIGHCNHILSRSPENEFGRGLDTASMEILNILEGD